MNKIRILLDTNIIVDFLLQRNNCEAAKYIIGLAVSDEAFECVTSTTITDISYLVGRYSNPKIDGYAVQEKIKDLLKIIDILSVSKADIEKALELHWKDMEDALQYAVAISNKCDCIVTNNIKDFEQHNIDILSPQDFIDKYLGKNNNDEHLSFSKENEENYSEEYDER